MKRAVAAILLAAFLPPLASAQDRIRGHEAFSRYSRLRGEIARAAARPDVRASWQEGGKALVYRKDGGWVRHDIASGRSTPAEEPARTNATTERDPRPRPARGRQYTHAMSPDGRYRAEHRNNNLYVIDQQTKEELDVTSGGSETARVRYGIASWVYGEELGVRDAIWWSPDGKKLLFYRADETKVRDYYLTFGNAALQTTLDVEPYPKAGTPNPVMDLLVYDMDSKETVTLDVRGGKPFDDDVVGHYVYSVRWSPDGKEVLFNRTNRRQNVMELTAADPGSGKCRVIVREEWPNSWTENSPPILWLDGKRFIWASERTGFRNYYLYDLSGRLLQTLTSHPFDVTQIVKADEQAGRLYYMGRSGDNPYKLQLHRVGFDGRGETRLTDPSLHHSVDLSPDGRNFVDVAEAHDVAPRVRLVSDSGKVLAELATGDTSGFEKLGLQNVELFEFTAADGKTRLYGALHFPSDFDSGKRYPLLVSVYAGPESGMLSERFTTPDPVTELGFLVARFDGRGTGARGKAFKDEMYLKCGVTEIDDQAAGARYLLQRPYVDASKVGIHGTSYGGYAAAMCLLRYPELFQAACASSAVTDWRNYDTIYTERYMWTPKGNKEGYDAGSCMTYAKNLKGRLMLFFGTNDNNVHPSNTYQLARALQSAGKSFDVQLGPDQGHAGINHDRMLEFFFDAFGLFGRRDGAAFPNDEPPVSRHSLQETGPRRPTRR